LDKEELEVQAANESARREITERAKNKIKDYRKVFGSESGRRVLHDLIATNYVMQPTITGKGIENPQLMAAREGQRIAVLNILAVLEMDPEKLNDSFKEIHNAAGK
jgi:hypothetical protein